ncbi:beta-ketoacyl synthase N-terminal-like domain-containing protein [Kitasatospora sp. NPDC093806]|uniref:beta-ketoacyl synthase N-terminal-like domain-containing protein n=1 Tax=Kitasatospora sp. NPDC093806 TaxID=3155075 RepID=UPI003448A855
MTKERSNDMTATHSAEPVAIVGMAVRLPGARTLDAFWQNLVDGVSAVREFTEEELAAAGVDERQRAHPDFVARGVPLEDVDRFDAGFFGFTPQEARVTDPQHRIFLETCWHALEDAGVVARAGGGAVGVFASSSLSTYLLHNILRSEEAGDGTELSYPVLIGNDKDFLATRVSYKLGLTGPSQTVQSACSSSLVALHQAAAALRGGECDVALAGGVSITVPQHTGYLHKEGGIASPDGHCRPFDQAAGGTVRGNGAGVVVLKRLADALADRDRIYAVVRGSAVTNDGSDKIGFTAPGIRGQARAVSAALAAAGTAADEIGYVEAHGTGTALGDPIEIRALTQAHNSSRECALGSVKANLGHLDAAAGIVGLIKTALVLHHQTVPPQINFTAANPHIPLDRSRYVVHTDKHVPAEPITAAAVSSFGLGGTNGHCVLGRHLAPERGPVPAGGRYLLPLSAQSPEALFRQAERLRRHLDEAHPRLDDLALTLGTGRTHWTERLAVVAATPEEARAGLDAFLTRGVRAGDHPAAWDFVGGGELAEAALGDLSAAVKTTLPGYPLEPRSHWIEPVRRAAEAPAPAQVPAPAPASAEADGEQVLADVLDVLRKLLGEDGMGPDDDFLDLGGDSLAAVEAASMLRERHRVELDFEVFADRRTPRAIAAHLAELVGGTADRSAMVRVREGEGPHLFLIYPAGGTNFCYFRLAEHLEFAGPLTAFAYPRELGDGPVTIRQLAALYIEQMRTVQPEGPYRLAGYSFGGNLAFEVALQLQRAGQEVSGLYLFDAHPPAAYVGESLTEEEFLVALPQMIASVMPDAGIDRSAAPPRSMAEAAEVLKTRPDWLASSEEEFLRFVRIWRRNHEALKGYYPDGKVTGNVVVFDAQVAHPEEEVALLRIKLLSKDHWRAHVDGAMEVVPVPGNHYTMFTDLELVPRLAAAFRTVLDGHGA